MGIRLLTISQNPLAGFLARLFLLTAFSTTGGKTVFSSTTAVGIGSGAAFSFLPRPLELLPAEVSLFASGCSSARDPFRPCDAPDRSEEHTSELRSRGHLVCRR